MVAFDSVLAIAVRTAVSTYAVLYDGHGRTLGCNAITIHHFGS
jgi:hypothetical protein